MSKIKCGVNYVPSNQWFQSWQYWDAEKTREDLYAIQSIGFDHIRIHLRWDLFQPFPNIVDKHLLARLAELLDIAHGCKLRVQVTVLNGWMSGLWFLPPWVVGKSPITDETVVEAEKLYFAAVLHTVGTHPAFMGLDLGNEIDIVGCCLHDFTREQGDHWLQSMFTFVKEQQPEAVNVVGVDHLPWFYNRYFSRGALANMGDMTSLHTWTKFSGAVDRYGALSPQSLYLVAYSLELANAYADDVNRPVWVQEFGISPEWTAPETFERFISASVHHALDCPNLWGLTWWCSHNIDRKFGGFEELEYDLGLLDTHNRLKPTGKILQNLIRDIRKAPVKKPTAKTALVLEEKLFDRQPDGIDFTLANAYINLKESGAQPCFIRESRLEDAAYLAARHIETICDIRKI